MHTKRALEKSSVTLKRDLLIDACLTTPYLSEDRGEEGALSSLAPPISLHPPPCPQQACSWVLRLP